MLHAPKHLLRQMRTCCLAGADIAAAAMAYICIDSLASILVAEDKSRKTREEFILWVDTYLKSRNGQPYQYTGIDLYAARCGLFHDFSPLSDLHGRHDLPIFCYKPGIEHWRTSNSNLVVIGTMALLRDIGKAARKFERDLKRNAELRSKADRAMAGRYTEIVVTVPDEGVPIPEPKRSLFVRI